MTPEKRVEVARSYRDQLLERGYEAIRGDVSVPQTKWSEYEYMCHIMHLADNVERFVLEGEIGKADRHLAYMQCMWNEKMNESIGSSRAINKPSNKVFISSFL